jgi:hypothetical protein
MISIKIKLVNLPIKQCSIVSCITVIANEIKYLLYTFILPYLYCQFMFCPVTIFVLVVKKKLLINVQNQYK